MKLKIVAATATWIMALSACGGDDGGSPADAGNDISSVKPGKRSDTSGVANPQTGVIAVFGGDNGPIVNQTPSAAYLSDTWVFDPTAGWTEATGAGPSARGRHTSAFNPNNGRMLAFGGRFRTANTSGNYTLYNDLWAFDFAEQTWTMLDDGAGTAPARRYFAASAYDDGSDTLFVWGGGTNAAPLSLTVADNLWAFDTDGWREVTLSGTAPSRRLFVAYAYDSDRNRLVVFGGQVGDFESPALNDLYAINLENGTWETLHNGSGTAPAGRFSAMMTYDSASDRYLLFGGHGDPGVLNDLWSFNPSDNTWQLERDADMFTGSGLGCLGNSREIPKGYVTEDLSAPERRSGGVLAILGADLWLFGGESDCSDHLDDTWLYDRAGQLWSEVLEAGSGESCTRKNVDCTCLCL